MNTFEQLFRAARSEDPEFITNDLLVKGANGEYWNAGTQTKYEWFKVGQAQNLAMLLRALHVEGFCKLVCDVEEVLNNEKA